MKVKELIEELSKLDPEMLVLHFDTYDAPYLEVRRLTLPRDGSQIRDSRVATRLGLEGAPIDALVIE